MLKVKRKLDHKNSKDNTTSNNNKYAKKEENKKTKKEEEEKSIQLVLLYLNDYLSMYCFRERSAHVSS